MFVISNYKIMAEEKKMQYRKRNEKRNEAIISFCSNKNPGKQLSESVFKMAIKYNLTVDAVYKILRSK